MFCWSRLNIHPVRNLIMKGKLVRLKRRMTVSILSLILVILCVVIVLILCKDIMHTKSIEEISINTIIDLVELIVTIFLTQQIGIMKDAEMMEESQFIYEENRQKRNNNDIENSVKLINYLSDNPDKIEDTYAHSEQVINQIISVDQMKDLLFHYEYLGQLTYYGKIHFSLLFDTITFPDDIWDAANKKCTNCDESFLEIIRKIKPDYWLGFEYLYRSYEVLRKKDSLDSICSGMMLSEDECKSSNRQQKCPKLVYNDAKKAYKKTVKDWYNCYKRMPR